MSAWKCLVCHRAERDGRILHARDCPEWTPPKGGPATASARRQAAADAEGRYELLVGRLGAPHRRDRYECPSCGDTRHGGLKVDPGADGPLLWCFGCCQRVRDDPGELRAAQLAILQAVGLDWSDVLPPGAKSYPALEPWIPEPAPAGMVDPSIVDDGADPAVDALIAEMLDTDGLDSIGDLEPLIDGVLSLDTLARLIGKSGDGKSFAALDMAAHIGTGQPWHGHAVHSGLVVYLVAEGARGIRKRVRAWEKRHGVKMVNVRFLPRPVNADSPEWGTLGRALRRLRPVLVILDTQARITVGMEENSNREMGVLVDRCDDIRLATGACVLLVHHLGHNGEEGRGATSIKGAMQTELSVVRQDRALTLSCPKQKDDADAWSVTFALALVDLGVDDQGRPVNSLVLVLSDDPFPEPEWRANLPERQGQIMTIIDDHYSVIGASLADLKRVGRERFGIPPTSCVTAVNALVGRGILVRGKGTQRYLHPGLTSLDPLAMIKSVVGADVSDASDQGT